MGWKSYVEAMPRTIVSWLQPSRHRGHSSIEHPKTKTTAFRPTLFSLADWHPSPIGPLSDVRTEAAPRDTVDF
ncbi:hypothetical protein CYK37_15210 [Mesorhizobium loti]|nr:hypothetical protein CYK37_15210 [Mesorhizobium loti]